MSFGPLARARHFNPEAAVLLRVLLDCADELPSYAGATLIRIDDKRCNPADVARAVQRGNDGNRGDCYYVTVARPDKHVARGSIALSLEPALDRSRIDGISELLKQA
jgi:hypothetical protein